MVNKRVASSHDDLTQIEVPFYIEVKAFFCGNLTRIINAKDLDKPVPVEEQIESDVQWARLVHLDLVPYPGIAHSKVIEVDFKLHNGMLALDIQPPIAGYSLRRWSVDCSTKHTLNQKEHHFSLKNSQTLYGVESAALAPGYNNTVDSK